MYKNHNKYLALIKNIKFKRFIRLALNGYTYVFIRNYIWKYL